MPSIPIARPDPNAIDLLARCPRCGYEQRIERADEEARQLPVRCDRCGDLYIADLTKRKAHA